MTRAEKLQTLHAWQHRVTTCREAIAPAIDIMGLDERCPLLEQIWLLETTLTAAIAQIVGDEAEWLDWYAHENAFGAKGMDAGPKDAMRPIKTPEDLLWLIEI